VSTDNSDIRRAIERAHSLQSRFNIFTSIEEPTTFNHGTGSLAGVPVAVKDLIDQAGRVTTCGSAFFRETPDRTAPAVRRLEDAGATVIGRTGLHEFAFGFSSENPHFGPVRNPWDPDTSAGGSSGGSAAAVAAGIVPIAIGTDTGGSVRVPAALCGCYGLKVTYGAIPLDGVFPLVPSIDTVGPIASSTAGLESAYRAMSRESGPLPELQSLRLGIPQPWYDEGPLSTEVDIAFRNAIEAIRLLGHQVNPIHLPDVIPTRRIGFAIAREVTAAHRDFRRNDQPYGDEVADRLDEASAVSDDEADEGRQWQEMIRSRFTDALATVDLLITPTVPSMRKTIGVDLIDGIHYRKVLSWFTSIVNHALLPAVALPLAGTGSPPVSAQVIGPPGSDLALLALARAIDAEEIASFVAAPVE
jgi:aspartyl-tRNA(Asn)/glutamyl-tRNA(Gln) amidotransferase subunit A